VPFPSAGSVQGNRHIHLLDHEDRDVRRLAAKPVWLLLDEANGEQDATMAAHGGPGLARHGDRKRDGAPAARGIRD
jgi:hypothetical protein